MTNAVKTSFKYELWRSDVLIANTPLKVVEVETTSDLLAVNTQLVGTGHELISIGDITDDAMVIIENLHATALVQVGHDVAAAFSGLIDIPALGPPAILPVATALATTYLKSDTASTPVRVTLVKIVAPA